MTMFMHKARHRADEMRGNGGPDMAASYLRMFDRVATRRAMYWPAVPLAKHVAVELQAVA